MLSATLACLLSECFQDKPLVNPLCGRQAFWQQSAHFLDAPNVIADSSFHCRGHAQRGMHAAEVVVHKPDRLSSRMVLNLFRERICQASETANAHTHGKVLPLNKTGAHMLGVWISAYNFHVTADAFRRGIARLVLVYHSVNLLQLCVINISAEGVLYRFEVRFVAVCRDLNAVANTLRAIFHELFCPSQITPADQIAHAKFRVGVQPSPRPNVPPPDCFLVWLCIPGLGSHELPNLIAL